MSSHVSPHPNSSPINVPSSSPVPHSSAFDANSSAGNEQMSSSQGSQRFGSSQRSSMRSSLGRRAHRIPLPTVAESSDADQRIIWGTSIKTREISEKCKRFILSFELPGVGLVYTQLLHEALLARLDYCVNLDTKHLLQFDLDNDIQGQSLYEDLIRYPQEVVPLFDDAFTEIALENYAEECNSIIAESGHEPNISIRPFNLRDNQPLRLLEPKFIDQLVSTRGMVIRVNAITPDMQSAFFRCTSCKHELEVDVEFGRIGCPKRCQNTACADVNSYNLVYHRCTFFNRQLVKVQENPEAIPTGETPHSIDVYCLEQLVDFVKPGDRIEVTGVYRTRAIRSNPRQRTVEAVYGTFVDAVHITKLRKAQGTEEDSAYSSFDSTQENQRQKRQHKRKMRELGEDPAIYDRLTKSFAPSIWEMDDVKKGLLCQLFGATAKNFAASETEMNNKFRNELNVLLCGDPGTSKSQLLMYVHKVAPRGIYTSGKGSSAVGLTAYITKDPETKDLILESGALVLSDRGICCIDEFDKMSQSAQSILHEVMEQQTVSIAKAGIIAQLNARTSILAAANPIESRYNPRKPVTENINLPPTLLSRFDLIYLVLDSPNMALDRTLAQHLVSLYYAEEDRPERPQAMIDQKTMQQYIAFSRQEIHPRLTDEAGEELVKAYIDMRNLGRFRGRKIISATPRNLESLIRLSEGLARMRHSELVSIDDVKEAVRLQQVATHAAATDPRTGQIDMGIIYSGTTDSERQRIEKYIRLLEDVLQKQAETNRNIKTSRVMAKLRELDDDQEDPVTERDLDKVLRRLEKDEVVRVDNRQADDPIIKIIN